MQRKICEIADRGNISNQICADFISAVVDDGGLSHVSILAMRNRYRERALLEQSEEIRRNHQIISVGFDEKKDEAFQGNSTFVTEEHCSVIVYTARGKEFNVRALTLLQKKELLAAKGKKKVLGILLRRRNKTIQKKVKEKATLQAKLHTVKKELATNILVCQCHLLHHMVPCLAIERMV